MGTFSSQRRKLGQERAGLGLLDYQAEIVQIGAEINWFGELEMYVKKKKKKCM